jgi:hypothetical protein
MTKVAHIGIRSANCCKATASGMRKLALLLVKIHASPQIKLPAPTLNLGIHRISRCIRHQDPHAFFQFCFGRLPRFRT